MLVFDIDVSILLSYLEYMNRPSYEYVKFRNVFYFLQVAMLYQLIKW